MKEIFTKIVEHWIKLVLNAMPFQQKKYQINPNYVEIMRHKLVKLLQAKFILLIVVIHDNHSKKIMNSTNLHRFLHAKYHHQKRLLSPLEYRRDY